MQQTLDSGFPCYLPNQCESQIKDVRSCQPGFHDYLCFVSPSKLIPLRNSSQANYGAVGSFIQNWNKAPPPALINESGSRAGSEGSFPASSPSSVSSLFSVTPRNKRSPRSAKAQSQMTPSSAPTECYEVIHCQGWQGYVL